MRMNEVKVMPSVLLDYFPGIMTAYTAFALAIPAALVVAVVAVLFALALRREAGSDGRRKLRAVSFAVLSAGCGTMALLLCAVAAFECWFALNNH